jgi:uncharacterized protein YdiU (UPF0061 family)
LADYVNERHGLEGQSHDNPYLALLQSVADRQADLIAKWMEIGFVHGVMNTDNMTVSGETIDYGPCAFLEFYNPQAVFSSIDHGGRYAFANQPAIASWNLARFAETLLPLIDEDPNRAVELASDVVHRFRPRYEQRWLAGACTKLGLEPPGDEDESPKAQLVDDWLRLLAEHRVDFTLAWRRLADVLDGMSSCFERLFPRPNVIASWLSRWQELLPAKPAASLAASMRAVNPIYIPRNHLVEEALKSASDDGDLAKFEQLLEVLRNPYDERSEYESYAQPAPPEFTACYQTFCGT